MCQISLILMNAFYEVSSAKKQQQQQKNSNNNNKTRDLMSSKSRFSEHISRMFLEI